MHRVRFASLIALTLVALPALVHAEPVDSSWVEAWRSDLAFMADSVPRQHPNYFHAVPAATYRAALDSLSRRLPRLAHHEIVVELARIVAMVGDGHTRLTFPFDSAAGFFTGHSTTAVPKVPGLLFRHYPIRLGLFADTLWVIRADSSHRDLLGGRVVSLGQRSAAEARAAIEPTVQRDNDSQVRDLLPTWLVCPEILHARGVVADIEDAPIVVELANGKRVNGRLAPVALGAAVRWLEARDPGPLPRRDRFPERAHWFERVSGTTTFYARYREVRNDPGKTVASFADSLFAGVNTARADRLVLDLRGNVGGNGFLNAPLVRRVIRAERLWRPGGLWVLTDRGTFSAAIMIAADLEGRTPALFAGEKTGGHPNSYGDSRRVVLPRSGMTVRVSSLYWQLTGPQDHRDGITPLVPVETRFADWKANRDPLLEAALALWRPVAELAGVWNGVVGWEGMRLPIQLDLRHQGATWSAGLDVPDAEVHETSLRATASGEVLGMRWRSRDGQDWALDVRRSGERVVGVLRYLGHTFPVALERGR